MYGQKLLQKHLWVNYEYMVQPLPVLSSSLSLLKGIAIKWKSASRGQGLYSGEKLSVFHFRRVIHLWKHSYALNYACKQFYSCIHQRFCVHHTPLLKLMGKFCLVAGEFRIKDISCFWECCFLLNDQYFSNLTFSRFLYKQEQLAWKPPSLAVADTACLGSRYTVTSADGSQLQTHSWGTAQRKWVHRPLPSWQAVLRNSLPTILGICLELSHVFILEAVSDTVWYSGNCPWTLRRFLEAGTCHVRRHSSSP